MVIPPKSDLIFDVELIAVKDMPAPPTPGFQPGQPANRGMFGARPGAPMTPNHPPAGSATPAAPVPPAGASAPAQPATPNGATAPSQPPAPAAAPAAPNPQQPK